jgi:hypothetical protein
MALSAASCLVLEHVGWGAPVLGFSHRVHVVSEEMECVDCHTDYEDSDATGEILFDECMICHEETDQELPPERRAVNLFENGECILQSVSELADEIIFSHRQHVTDEEGCADCHQAIIESDAVRPWMAGDMQRCMDCHEDSNTPNDCETCHTEIRVDTPPDTHGGGWDEHHGLAVRNNSDKTVDNCAICHEESTCKTCHLEEMPRNHNNYWRRRAHGLTAAMDRENCAACHGGPDFCDRCHQEAEPQSHTALWGGQRNTHCYSCHISDAEQSCFFCHKEGTPSHLLAPPRPPGDPAGSDCRSCHTVLTHVDNGDDCNLCHL